MKRLRWSGFVGLAACLAVSQALAADPDLVIYLDFEEISDGKILDKSGKNHHGLIQGKVTLEDGKYGKAGRFPSSSFLDMDGANFPAADIPREGMSVVAWVNVDSLGNDHAIFNARAGDATWVVHPEVRAENKYRWLLRSDGSATIFEIKAGTPAVKTWVHYAGVYDSNEGMARLYINGEEVGTAPGKQKVAKDWGMGARVGFNIDNARPFTGMMDDLSIWKRGLKADEVKSVMESGPLPKAVAPRGKLATTWARLRQ